MAESIIKRPFTMSVYSTLNSTNSQDTTLTVPDISIYNELVFKYGDNIVSIPVVVYKQITKVRVNLPGVTNGICDNASFERISDTSIKVVSTQGSTKIIYGVR